MSAKSVGWWRRARRSQLPLVACAVAMYGMIELSFAIGFAQLAVVSVWPASGLAYWMVARFGLRAVPFVFLGDFAYAAVHLQPKAFYIAISAGNALAVTLGVLAARRAARSLDLFDSPRSMAVFLTAGAGVLSVVAAVIGTSLIAWRFQPPAQIVWELGWRWLLSDYTGAVIVAPMLFGLACSRAWRQWANRRAAGDSIGLVVLLALLLLLELTGNAALLGYYSTVLLTLPFVVWMAMRTPPARLGLGYFLVAVIALLFTLQSVGATGKTFLAIQLYLCVVIATGLLMNSVNAHRRQMIRDLEQGRAELEQRVAARTADLAKEVQERQLLAEELRVLATTDPLTGVANRRHFFDQGELELARHRRSGAPLSVVLLDLDHFKDVNDRLGHAAGDEVLRLITATIDGAVREIDLLGRIGGEEFAVLLPETGLDGAVAAAHRIRAAVAAATFPVGDLPAPTCSFGVTEVTTTDADIGVVLSRADTALYEAKRSGRDRVVTEQPRIHHPDLQLFS